MHKQVQSLCVFCGSSMGAREEYRTAAQAFGTLLAKRGITLVYGGGHIGLMGVLADAALHAGGRVVGVIPQILYTKEIAHQHLSELRVVDSMSDRKAVMGELSDAFIALPGGVGTLDELFEVWTWTLLGLQQKAIGLLNVDRYFDSLLTFLDQAVAEKFLRANQHAALMVDTDAERLLTRIAEHQPN